MLLSRVFPSSFSPLSVHARQKWDVALRNLKCVPASDLRSEYNLLPKGPHMNKRPLNRYRYAAARIVGLARVIAVSGLAATFPDVSGPAKDGSPAWHIYLPPAAGGRGVAAASDSRGGTGNLATASQIASMRLPACGKSTICGMKGGKPRGSVERVEWEQTLGYTISYPFTLPSTAGGVPGVALDSRGNFWVLQRSPAGSPQLYKFDSNYKLLFYGQSRSDPSSAQRACLGRGPRR